MPLFIVLAYRWRYFRTDSAARTGKATGCRRHTARSTSRWAPIGPGRRRSREHARIRQSEGLMPSAKLSGRRFVIDHRGHKSDSNRGSRLEVRTLLRLTAVLECLTALALLVFPSALVRLLLGQPLDTALGILVARLAGAALLALGMACWWAANDPGSSAASGLVRSMLLYDAAAIVLLVYALVVAKLSGIALWPAIFVHTALAAWCIHGIQHK
jgi:hypothetical protein